MGIRKRKKKKNQSGRDYYVTPETEAVGDFASLVARRRTTVAVAAMIAVNSKPSHFFLPLLCCARVCVCVCVVFV
jgi:hypothetical protein